MPATVKLSSKFKILVPKMIRDDLEWKAGQKFAFIPKGKGVLLLPVPDLEQLAGIASGVSNRDYRERPNNA